MNKRIKDLTGKRFDRWKVIRYNPKKSKEMGRPYWDCICDCGTKKCVDGKSLKNGDSKSCGCLKREKEKERMSGKNNHNWKGGKEIIICKQCGKEKKVKSYRKNTAQFCSRKCEGRWMSENLKGENSRSWKEKEIIICKQCGKEKKVFPCLKDTTKFCSTKCEYQWMSENNKKENNPNWKNGITPLQNLIRTSKKYKKFVQKTLKEANYICCLSKEIGGNLGIHHIKGFAKILKENNITTVEKAENCKELWDEKNVVVLSEKWHLGVKTYNPNAFHRLYGKHNFTEEDFYEWFNEFSTSEKVFERNN